ncbi:hypothetical protein C8R46DRAFT_1191860 [Mycena filopes]|nr:hypothetical protein C8R46DRAFT_1191860 [Mycena filopes]
MENIDLERLLRTNDAPLEVEAAALEQKIASERTRVNQLRATMAKLRSSAAAERRIEELEEAEKTLKAYSTILSPARRVPVEILSEIFSQAPHTRRLGQRTVETAPWRLGLVCQRWRAVALADTRLWSSITIASSGTATKTCPPEMVETQLLRSGLSALTVTIDCQEGRVTNDLLKSIKLCVAVSNQWGTLRLRGLDYIMGARILPLLRAANGRLDTLFKLELLSTQRRPRDWVADAEAVPIDPGARYDPTHYLDRALALPFAQLTHFAGFFPSHRQALNVLRAAPNLVKFAVSFAGRGAAPDYLLPLPKLRYLSVAAPTRENLDFLSDVTVPNLQGLWIWGDAVMDIPQCVERSRCQLTKLVVHRCADPSDLLGVLHSLPTLTTLFVEFASGILGGKTRPLFDALRIRDGVPEVCPNLTHLAAGGSSAFGVTAFVEMAASRWYEVESSPLVFVRAFRGRDAYASTNARVPKAVVDCLSKMSEEGVDAAFELSESSGCFRFGGPCAKIADLL